MAPRPGTFEPLGKQPVRDFGDKRPTPWGRDQQAAAGPGPAPGKKTLTETLPATSSPVQRKADAVPATPTGPRPSITDLFGRAERQRQPSGGREPDAASRPNLFELFGVGVQRRAAAAEPDVKQIHTSARRGVTTTASPPPHVDTIQRLFGRHDISGIQAHVGADAAASARAIGAEAYATGNHVVLGDRADLHTVAHEAAHVVQQRSGVQLFGGVGQTGDRYEQHADQVATLVEQGRSAEHVLDEITGDAPKARETNRATHSPGPIQRMHETESAHDSDAVRSPDVVPDQLVAQQQRLQRSRSDFQELSSWWVGATHSFIPGQGATEEEEEDYEFSRSLLRHNDRIATNILLQRDASTDPRAQSETLEAALQAIDDTIASIRSLTEKAKARILRENAKKKGPGKNAKKKGTRRGRANAAQLPRAPLDHSSHEAEKEAAQAHEEQPEGVTDLRPREDSDSEKRHDEEATDVTLDEIPPLEDVPPGRLGENLEEAEEAEDVPPGRLGENIEEVEEAEEAGEPWHKYRLQNVAKHRRGATLEKPVADPGKESRPSYNQVYALPSGTTINFPQLTELLSAYKRSDPLDRDEWEKLRQALSGTILLKKKKNARDANHNAHEGSFTGKQTVTQVFLNWLKQFRNSGDLHGILSNYLDSFGKGSL